MVKNFDQENFKREIWTGSAFRNIATCDPMQDIYDDLVDPEDYSALLAAERISRGIDAAEPKQNRWFQYGKIDKSTLCFEAAFFKWSRFSDGSFGVWYGALDEDTSIRETSHKRPELDANDFKNALAPIIQCRQLFKVSLKSEAAVDLINKPELRASLISDDYQVCQDLGAYAVKRKIEMYLTPSARNHGGICIALFAPGCVKDETVMKTYLLIYSNETSAPRVASITNV